MLVFVYTEEDKRYTLQQLHVCEGVKSVCTNGAGLVDSSSSDGGLHPA